MNEIPHLKHHKVKNVILFAFGSGSHMAIRLPTHSGEEIRLNCLNNSCERYRNFAALS